MIKIIAFIASVYLLIEFLSRTEQGPDGKVHFKKVPQWVALINGIFRPSAKSTVVEVEVKAVDDEANA